MSGLSDGDLDRIEANYRMDVGSVAETTLALVEEVRRLRAGITQHRDRARSDDLCVVCESCAYADLDLWGLLDSYAGLDAALVHVVTADQEEPS